ncbi:MAG: sortase [Clostridiales bacterium]|nr:sortase [Clostridiales bacterium]
MKKNWISIILLTVFLCFIVLGTIGQKAYELQEELADETDLQLRRLHNGTDQYADISYLIYDADEESADTQADDLYELQAENTQAMTPDSESENETADLLDSSYTTNPIPLNQDSADMYETSSLTEENNTGNANSTVLHSSNSQGQAATVKAQTAKTTIEQSPAADDPAGDDEEADDNTESDPIGDNSTEEVLSAGPEQTPMPTTVSEGLLKLHSQNSDCIAWIKIPGTGIDYPVMYKPESKDYYIHRDFYGKSSSRGSLYLSEICDIDRSDNLIIYGHNMKNGTMFAKLTRYKDKSFYSAHRYITLETLSGTRTYEIICALSTPVNTGSDFKYYNFSYASNEGTFGSYVAVCKARDYYETGVTAVFGQQLLTLSTCEYSQKNGRMLVIAKRIK